MVFSSIDFIFKFLPAFLLVYAICPAAWKNGCLFFGSLIFYFYGVKDQPVYIVLFLCSVGVNYVLGVLIGNVRRQKKKWLRIGLIYNFFWLILFKYSGFLAENVNQLLAAAGIGLTVPVYRPVLPIGISFYTFQAAAYLIDLYRGRTAYEGSLIDFGAYLSMFPKLVAGPIAVYTSVKKEIKRRKCSMRKIEEGLREFTIGLGLKVLIADQVGGLWKEVGTIGFESISTPLAWMGLAAFSLQIYFDSYGYSLMAQGLGTLLGFRLTGNFDYTYMSISMTEFLRRWHITLGSWFREYVYIPLGGNRTGWWRTCRNLLTVWLLTGIWHGASWNFILWGLILFLIILIEKSGLGKILNRWPAAGHLYMLFVIPLTWLIFAVTDLPQIGIYLHRLFPFFSGGQGAVYFAGDYLKYGKLYGLSLTAGLIFMTDGPRKLYERWKKSPVSAVLLLAVFWFSIYCIKRGMNDPFLYFQF